jgi:hypothetical protein
VNLLLTGKGLPLAYQGLFGGISPEVTDSMARKSVLDLGPQFQQGGILDSGVAANIASQTAADIRNKAEQFNLQNKFNLLNLALSGQGLVQSPLMQLYSNLGNNLSGLRTSTVSGPGAANPFFTSLGSSAGQSIGEKVGGLLLGNPGNPTQTTGGGMGS